VLAQETLAPNNKRLGMKLFIISDAMTFAALLLAFLYLRWTGANWPAAFRETNAIYAIVMSGSLFLSSWTMMTGVSAARSADWRGARRWVFVTMVFGMVFVVLHLNEWRHLAQKGLSPKVALTNLTDASHSIGSAFFGITGLHMIHVLSGVALLGFLFARRRREQVDLEIAGMYWQFVDVVWVFVFLVLYIPLIT
jgi:cytochrome c oxidase subunit III